MHVDYRLILQRLTTLLLQPDGYAAQWQQACEDLYDLLVAAGRLLPDALSAHRTDLFLPCGKALAPAWAAMCIKDFYRTRQFLRGLEAAIKTLMDTIPDTPIHIVYAGTGPFAPLALPLTTLFAPQNIQFTLLEINPESVQMLKNTWASFHAEAFIHRIECTDATTYVADQPVHIVLTETMQQALQEEPQVAITCNLAPQIVPGGILIPEKITISAGVYNFQNTLDGLPQEWHKIEKSTLLELTAHTRASAFPEIIVEVPENSEEGYSQFCLYTEIKIFQDILLESGESGLTQPKILLSAGKDSKFRTRKMGFQYVQDRKPGFRNRVIDACP